MPEPTPYHEVPYVGDIDFTTNPPTRRNRYTPPPSTNTAAPNDATSTVGTHTLPPRPRGPHAPTPLDAIIHDYFNDGYGLTDLAEIHAIPIAQLLEIFDSPEVAARINRITAIADRRARNIATVKAHQAIAILNNIACTDQSSRPETARRAAHALLNAANIPLPKSHATKPTTPTPTPRPDPSSSARTTNITAPINATTPTIAALNAHALSPCASELNHDEKHNRENTHNPESALQSPPLAAQQRNPSATPTEIPAPHTPSTNNDPPPTPVTLTPTTYTHASANTANHTPAPPKLSAQTPLATPPTPSPSIPESPTPTPKRIAPWSPSPTPAVSSPPPKRKQPKSASP